MAKALPSGRPRGRVLFGALDADSWTWAGLKAFFWFIAIILLLGYIPDRAYYFTVNRTIDVGILLWSPVNLCPAENNGLPCPAPVGAVVPWQQAPGELTLPEAREHGAAGQLGSTLLYVGGSNGTAATTTTYTSTIKDGTFSAWTAGPELPEARESAGLALLNGTAYLVGGNGPDGKPTTTVWALASNPETGALDTWKPVKDVVLPEARAGAAVLGVSDGILVAGGVGPDGKPTTTVWKASTDTKGVLSKFAEQPALLDGVTNASVALQGTFVWVYGGTDAKGPTGAVQRGSYGQPGSGPAGSGSVAPAPTASAAAVPDAVLQWAISDTANLPEARSNGSGWTANGALYIVGGSDGQHDRRELYWSTPDANGDLTGGWHHLDVIDLPGGLVGGAPVTTGSSIVVIGGSSDGAIQKGTIRASLAPEEPFFQLGPFGAVVPALKLPGEIGQQLGYISAAGAGTADFVLLLVFGWMFANKAKVRGWWDRRRERRRRA
jgi:hypothetical protein